MIIYFSKINLESIQLLNMYEEEELHVIMKKNLFVNVNEFLYHSLTNLLSTPLAK